MELRWYLIHTKPRQERVALENLERQGYECYLPIHRVEKMRQGIVAVADEPLFPRYLFIRLGEGGAAKSWGPIRSTRGVSRLVSFGVEPVKVSDTLIVALCEQEKQVLKEVEPLFKHGEVVRLTEAPFSGLEGVYEMADGERRAMVLIELLSKQVRVRVASVSLCKVG